MDIVTLILYLSTILIILFYLYTKFVSYNYWKRRNIVSIKPVFPFGNAARLVFLKTSFGLYFAEAYSTFKRTGARYGGCYMLNTPVFVPVSPDLIKNIHATDFKYFTDTPFSFNKSNDPLTNNLIFLQGQEWRNLRKNVTHVFTSGKIKQMFPTLLECCKELETKIDKAVEDKNIINLMDLFTEITIDFMGKCVYGARSNQFKQLLKNFTNNNFDKNNNVLLALATPNLLKLFKVRSLDADTTNFFHNIVKSSMAERQISSEQNNYLFSTFMEVLAKGGNITFGEIAAQCFHFMFAGTSSTTTTLTFCLLELMLNKNVYENVIEEINLVMCRNDETMTYEEISNMKYLDMVIKETLRKYPTSPTIFKMCTTDYPLPDSDAILKARTPVCVSVLGLHMDPEYFPEPENFKPERFLTENEAARKSLTYLPFSDGPRHCIGFRFAMVQMKVILIAILRKYNFSPKFDSHHCLTEIDDTGLILKPKYDIIMIPKKL